jgi:phytoene dehydrogenase-like protein
MTVAAWRNRGEEGAVAADGYDVAIVGAGPNGLTAAAYLARAGARVALLERRFERGGTFATDDYSTPYLYNLAQFELPLGEELQPYADLDLRSHGVRFEEPTFPFAARTEPRGPELVVGRGGRGLGGEIEDMFAAASSAVAPLLYRPPSAEDELLANLRGGPQSAAAALAETTPAALAEGVDDPRAGIVLRYACGLAGFLDGDVPLGLIGAFALVRLFSPAVVVGGTKNLANALARVAIGAGARGLVTAEVTEVERDRDGLRLRTADARDLRARTVISTLDPQSTFLRLLDDGLAPAELRSAAERWVVDGAGPFTCHYGIKGEPPAPASGEASDALIRIFGFGGPADVARHFESALSGRLSPRVAGHLTAVTAHDPLQASPGPYGPLHTLRVQTVVPFAGPDGGWDRARAACRQECWEALMTYFEGLDETRLLFQFCDTPLDIERRFATTRGGTIRQGALVREQTLVGRPHPSCSTGRTPVAGLYLGGGAVHPGVPGTLAGGYNAAAVVAEDLDLAFPACT